MCDLLPALLCLRSCAPDTLCVPGTPAQALVTSSSLSLGSSSLRFSGFTHLSFLTGLPCTLSSGDLFTFGLYSPSN